MRTTLRPAQAPRPAPDDLLLQLQREDAAALVLLRLIAAAGFAVALLGLALRVLE